MKDVRGQAKREAEYQAREAAQRCRHCHRWSSKLRRGGICPRCELLRTTEPAEAKKKADARQ